MKIEIKINGNEYKFEHFIIESVSKQHEQLSKLLEEIVIAESKFKTIEELKNENTSSL